MRALSPRAALVGLLLAACGPASFQSDCPAARGGRDAAAYVVGAGDVLSVNVWQNADLTAQVTVRPDGVITLPLIGELRASGQRPTQVQEEITRRLSRFLTAGAQVTVTVVAVNSYRIYVLGQVTTPGELRPRSPVKILQALALAGGLTRFAQPDAIVVVRHHSRGECRIPFDMGEAVEGGRLDENLLLESGDTVFVP